MKVIYTVPTNKLGGAIFEQMMPNVAARNIEVTDLLSSYVGRQTWSMTRIILSAMISPVESWFTEP